jgi:integrase
MGLGSTLAVSLARAREKAAEARALVAEGLDPLAAKQAARRIPTFGEAADALIASLEPSWRNEKHRAQWVMTLRDYAKPLRDLPVDRIETADVLAVVQPIWQSKSETASRLRGRIEKVLDYAKAHGHRTGENPAAWRGHLALVLPARPKLSRGHHARMEIDDVPAFMAQLRDRESVAARCLEFLILTATRTSEALRAQWSEINLETKVWTLSAQRMKAAREHRIPLSGRTLEILAEMEPMRQSAFIFPGQRRDKPLSTMALEMVLRRMEIEDATVHGFRSCFRDWAGNRNFPRELAEHALAHSIGDKAEQAYRRDDAVERRRALMEAWERFLAAREATNVVHSMSSVALSAEAATIRCRSLPGASGREGDDDEPSHEWRRAARPEIYRHRGVRLADAPSQGALRARRPDRFGRHGKQRGRSCRRARDAVDARGHCCRSRAAHSCWRRLASSQTVLGACCQTPSGTAPFAPARTAPSLGFHDQG